MENIFICLTDHQPIKNENNWAYSISLVDQYAPLSFNLLLIKSFVNVQAKITYAISTESANAAICNLSMPITCESR